MKKITLFSILAVLLAAMSFTSCNSSSDNSVQLPTKQEALAMMQKVAGSGTHKCGILFPKDSLNNIKTKDSIEAAITITPSDSSYTITNFPVKYLAKYVNDEKLSKLIEALPAQTIKGKLYATSATTPLFYTATQNITFKDESSNTYTLLFYSYNSYAMAGLTNDSKYFLMYLTPGAIYNGTQIISGALKTATGTYSSNVPYTMFLRYAL